MQVQPAPGKAKGIGMSRDADGNPKLTKELTQKYWESLNQKDKTFLKNKYSLEIDNG